MTFDRLLERPGPAAFLERLRRVATLGLPILGMVAILYGLMLWLAPGAYPIDTHNYLEAGARLNAGQSLYAELDLPSGYAQVAIFSPPLIGVLFRPLAALPRDLGMGLWVGLMAACEISSIILLVIRTPVRTGLAMILLAPAIILTLVVGNIDALVLLTAIIAWRLIDQGHQSTAGLLLGLIASLKLAPVVLIWWAIVTGRRRAAVLALAASVVLALVAMLGTEPLIFVNFARITFQNFGGSAGPLSIATLSRGLGIPSNVATLLPGLALIGGLVLIVALRHRPKEAWVVAVALLVVSSPVAAFHTPALLLGCLAPYGRARGVHGTGASERRSVSVAHGEGVPNR